MTTLSRTQAFKRVMGLAAPISTNRFIDRTAPFVATIFLASMGSPYLVASAIITPIQMLLLSAAVGMGNSINTMVAKVTGNRELEDAEKTTQIRQILQQALFYTFIVGLVSSGLMLTTPLYSHFLTHSSHISGIIKDFFYGYAPGFTFYLMTCAYSQLTVGLGKAWPSVGITALNTALSILVGGALAYGKAGLPNLGAFGLGLGFSIASVISLGVYLLTLSKAEAFKDYFALPFTGIRESAKHWPQLTNGVRIGMKIGFDRLSLIVTTILASLVGHDALKAQEICLQFLFITMVPLFGLATVAGKFAAQYIKDAFPDAKRIAEVTLAVGLLYTGIVLGLYAAIPTLLSSLFIDTHLASAKPVLDIVKPVLLIMGAGQVCEAVRSIVAGALRGFPAPKQNLLIADKPDTSYPMWLALFITVVFDAGLGYGMGISASIGLSGVFAARTIGLAFAGALLGARWDYQAKNQQGSVPAGSWRHAFFRGAPISNTGTAPLLGSVDEGPAGGP